MSKLSLFALLFMPAISLCLHNISSKSYILDALLDAPASQDITLLARQLYDECIENKIALSQTEAHLLKYAQRKMNSIRAQTFGHNVLSAFEADPVLRQVVHEIIALEKQEAKKGNVTFVHGQPWILQFYQDLYTHLWQLLTRVPIKDFFFLRFKHLYVHDVKRFATKLDKHVRVRERYIAKGTSSYYTHCIDGKQNRNYLLFVNYALFSNRFGSSSARYIAKGDAENGIFKSLNIRDMFAQLGIESYYAPFACELEQLRVAHEVLTKHKNQTYGHPVLISLEPHGIEKFVYMSYTGLKKSFRLTEHKRTTSIKEVVLALRTRPYDLIDLTGFYPDLSADYNEFSMILSLDGALNPQSGIKIFTVAPVAKPVWRSYCQKRDELFARIEHSIKHEKYGAIDQQYWRAVVAHWLL